ncbi:unnamed protein product, partial [Mesorhabditis belari]|uniref:C-type lectin domain-containing protein n=1 Tax=Mesorhabditis belari TaxID=2138241 RepID=A0AAF3FIA1_9BILA
MDEIFVYLDNGTALPLEWAESIQSSFQLKHIALGFDGGLTPRLWNYRQFSSLDFLKRSIAYPMKRDGKYIMKTETVRVPWIHSVKKFFGQWKSLEISTDDLFLLHMRTDFVNLTDKTNLFPGMHLFEPHQITALRTTLKEIFGDNEPPYRAQQTQPVIDDCMERAKSEIPGEDCLKPTGRICYSALKDLDDCVKAFIEADHQASSKPAEDAERADPSGQAHTEIGQRKTTEDATVAEPSGKGKIIEASPQTNPLKVNTYTNVVSYCQSKNGIPVKIANVYENSYAFVMTGEMDTVPVYIGVHLNESTNQWTYSDGTPLIYQNWATGQPSSGNSCAYLDPQSGKWGSVDCSVAMASICSIDGTMKTTTTTKRPTTTAYSGPCLDERWTYWNVTGYCYYLEGVGLGDTILGERWELYSWLNAEYDCRLMGSKSGSHLVSIHSKEEEDYVYQLVASNMTEWPSQYAWGSPCFYQPAWIGYYGNGLMGNGNWTDGTPVDYLSSTLINETAPWKISNDPSCNEVRMWLRGNAYLGSAEAARYVCKSPSIYNMPTTTPVPSTPVPTRSLEDDLNWDWYDWWTAEEKCQSYSDGGHLASIHSKNEEDFIYQMLSSSTNSSTVDLFDTWIGYFGNGTVRTGNWTDGTPVDYIGQFKRDWSPARPNQVYAWKISNDVSCACSPRWWLNDPDQENNRFVCKYPSYNGVSNEKYHRKVVNVK